MASRFPELSESDLTPSLDKKNSDRMIKQLCDPTPPILKLSANQVVRIRLTVTPPCKLESSSFVGSIGHFGKYHNTLCLSPQILHKHCFCFLLGPL